jgi:hypothetical protein
MWTLGAQAGPRSFKVCLYRFIKMGMLEPMTAFAVCPLLECFHLEIIIYPSPEAIFSHSHCPFILDKLNTPVIRYDLVSIAVYIARYVRAVNLTDFSPTGDLRVTFTLSLIRPPKKSEKQITLKL